MDGNTPGSEREPVSASENVLEADEMGNSNQATTQGQGQDSQLREKPPAIQAS